MEKHSISIPLEGRTELHAKVAAITSGHASGTLVHYPEFVRNLFKLMGDPASDMMHACTGLSGEGGEILDIAKKVWVYGKQLDARNLVEELGDLRFYYQAALNLLGTTDEAVADLPVDRRTVVLLGGATDTLLRACGNLSVHSSKALDLALELWDGANMSGMDENELNDLLLEQLSAVRAYYFYLLGMLDLEDIHIQAHNMFKLSLNPDARFPGGVYTDAAAIARADKVAEGETQSSGV